MSTLSSHPQASPSTQEIYREKPAQTLAKVQEMLTLIQGRTPSGVAQQYIEELQEKLTQLETPEVVQSVADTLYKMLQHFPDRTPIPSTVLVDTLTT